MSLVELIIIGITGFALSILSGIAGGGGGFVMTPLLIFLGLTPAQAVATGKLGGLSMALGSLKGMSSRGKINKKLVVIVIIISIAAGLASSRVIVNLNEAVYGDLLGVALIILAPLMYFKKVGHASQHVTKTHKIVGFIGLAFALLLQGIFSAGLGVLVSFALMLGLGLNAIEANITKRTSQIFLNSVIIISLLNTGLIQWGIAGVIVSVNLVGSYIGGRIAVKKGSAFVSTVMASLALVSGIALVLI